MARFKPSKKNAKPDKTTPHPAVDPALNPHYQPDHPSLNEEVRNNPSAGPNRIVPGKGYKGVFAEVTEFASDMDMDESDDLQPTVAEQLSVPDPAKPAVSAIDHLFATEVASDPGDDIQQPLSPDIEAAIPDLIAKAKADATPEPQPPKAAPKPDPIEESLQLVPDEPSFEPEPAPTPEPAAKADPMEESLELMAETVELEQTCEFEDEDTEYDTPAAPEPIAQQPEPAITPPPARTPPTATAMPVAEEPVAEAPAEPEPVEPEPVAPAPAPMAEAPVLGGDTPAPVAEVPAEPKAAAPREDTADLPDAQPDLYTNPAPDAVTERAAAASPAASKPSPSITPPRDLPSMEGPWSWFALGCNTALTDPKTGQTLPRRAGLILDTAVDRVAEALTATVGRPVKVRRKSKPSPIDPALDGFAFRIALGDSGATAVIALDSAAAHALTQPLIADATSLHTPASPGPTDSLDATTLGLLEYLTLAGLDAALQDLGPGHHATLEAFGGMDLFRVATRAKEQVETGFRVSVGGLRGSMHIAMIGLDASDASAIPTPTDHHADQHFGVALALPEVELSDAEREELAPGDVILLGPADLHLLAADARLVTDTGWDLGSAKLTEHQSTHLLVVPGELTPAPLKPSLNALPRFGRAQHIADDLREWPAGQPLRIPLDANAPLELVIQGRVVARGEPVVLGNELGMRLLSVTPLSAAEAQV